MPDMIKVTDIMAELGRSRSYVNRLRRSEKFKRNVPNKTPAGRPSFLRSDFERFKKLDEWW